MNEKRKRTEYFNFLVQNEIENEENDENDINYEWNDDYTQLTDLDEQEKQDIEVMKEISINENSIQVITDNPILKDYNYNEITNYYHCKICIENKNLNRLILILKLLKWNYKKK
jgi:hypothetical protein